MDFSKSEPQDVVKRKQRDQGLHECEVFGGDSELMESCRTWECCTKNPGHCEFIPYSEFRPSHLPADWYTPERLEVLRIIAATTVRIRVGYTSLGRPEGFAFYNNRGTDIVHTGSGWVFDHRSCQDEPCPCSECAESSTPRSQWMEIIVATASHVVYDTEEAQATLVDLFYDDERARRNGKMKTVEGVDVSLKDDNDDVCLLRCVTHDPELCEKINGLRDAAAKFVVHQQNLEQWYPTVGNVCVIMSHPHGRPKHVTVGQVQAVEKADGVLKKLTYSASTCPGSSGALVLPMDAVGSARPARSVVHSLGGVSPGLNQSSSVFHHYRPRYNKLFCREFSNKQVMAQSNSSALFRFQRISLQ